jgi:ABC-2 type transport system permease protein
VITQLTHFLSLQKIAYLMRARFIQTLDYRWEILVWIFSDSIPFLVYFFVWQSIFSTQAVIKGLTLVDTLQYFVLVFLINALTDVHFEGYRCRQIRDGQIDHLLIRPFSYLKEVFWRDFAGKLTYLIIFMPIFSGLILLGSYVLSSPLFFISPDRWFGFISLLLIIYCLNFFVAYLIVLLTFWIEGANGLEHFKWLTVGLFGGSLMPVNFMPSWLQSIINVLPFKYLFAVPISWAQGKYSWQVSDSLYVATLLLGMYGVCKIIEKKGFEKYSSAGG